MNLFLRTTALVMLTGALMLAATVPALAAGFNPGNANIPGVPGGNNLATRIANIINAFLGLSALVAAIAIIYGGFRYITAAGDEEGASKGKQTVLYAIIGLIIVGLSAVIANFIIRAINNA